MKAILLAAGLGTRMRPLTDDKPKALLPVLGKPIIEHIVEALPQEVSDLIVVIGYKGDMVREYMGEIFLGKKVSYVEQEKATGTAHALFMCQSFFEEGEKFLFLMADDIFDKESFAKFLLHDRVALVAEVPDPRRFGVMEVDGSGKVVGMEEKPQNPKSNLISTGDFAFDTNIFKYKPEQHPNGEYFVAPLVEQMIKDGKEIYAEEASLWIPIGYPEDLKKAEEILKARGLKNSSEKIFSL